MFPDSSLMSELALFKMSERAKSNNPGTKMTDETRRKIKETKREKYISGELSAWNKGTPQTQEVKDKLSKANKERYKNGAVHWNQGLTHSEATKEKIRQTLIGNNISPETKQKQKDAILRKKDNGTFTPGMLGKKHSEETKSLLSAAGKKRNIAINAAKLEEHKAQCLSNNILLKEKIDNTHFILECLDCNTQFQRTANVFHQSKNYYKDLCPTCFPIKGISDMEIELHEFIKSIYDEEILFNDTVVLGGKEIDILIPKLNIGFEFDGLYWHSIKVNTDKNHLLYKTQFAHNKGIKLYHIFEDEWKSKKEIVKSRISHLLKVPKEKIHARHCTISKIENDIKNTFLDEFHIQGKDISSIRYGAFYKNELIGVMTFTKSSYVKGR